MALIKKTEETNAKLYFLDPVHQTHNNENGYAWQIRGAKGTKQVKSNTGRRRLNIVGALDPTSLEVVSVLTEANCNKELMIEFFKHIRYLNKDKAKIYIVCDNAGYNRAKMLKAIALELNIEIVYLPPYCPNLNLIERLWKYFKMKIMKNRYYKSFEEFYEAVSNFFKKLDLSIDDLRSLLMLNFGIIKAI